MEPTGYRSDDDIASGLILNVVAFAAMEPTGYRSDDAVTGQHRQVCPDAAMEPTGYRSDD